MWFILNQGFMTKNHPMFSKSHAAEGADQVVLPAAADVGW